MSPGLFHYYFCYFASKCELLAAVAREAADRHTRAMAEIRAAPPRAGLAEAARLADLGADTLIFVGDRHVASTNRALHLPLAAARMARRLR